MKFQVTYPSGKVEVVNQEDCQTVEQFINVKFGRNAKPKAKVELVGAESVPEATKEAKPTKSTRAKK